MEFEEFAAVRTPALLRYAYMLCGDRELARDLTQEVLIRSLVKWRRVSRAEHPDAYLRAMLTNEFLSLRRRKVVATVAVPYDGIAELGAKTASPEGEYAERAAMMQRLGTLPRRQRAVVVLRYYEDLSDAQIAEILGCRESTVRAYAARALAALRVEMAPRPKLAAQSGGGS
ncbi:SigE family RNA polymerase sigma factor [Yinghuangia sp. YIM S09857]|uniref:SigE family RNA polymerase sigma factor n=1 Tax=Yinghuangia sp. YIM S09857 TaxID=3436929 RepID=UPI003F530942